MGLGGGIGVGVGVGGVIWVDEGGDMGVRVGVEEDAAAAATEEPDAGGCVQERPGSEG